MLLVGRALVGIAGRYRDAVDAHLLDAVEKVRDLLGIGVVEQRAIDAEAEAAFFGLADGGQRLVVDAVLADRAVVHLTAAVHVHRPHEKRARLVLCELLFHQQRIGAQIDELLARHDALDDLG